MKKLLLIVWFFFVGICALIAQDNIYIYYANGKSETVAISEVDSISFTPSVGIGNFKISPTRYVSFSPGNLQYHPKNDEWRFAPSQLDYIGTDNKNISSTYDGWIDLFGCSADNTTAPFGVSSSEDNDDYLGDFVDWGSNQIGADAPNTWRTLTRDEWNYLLYSRPNASSLHGVACVSGVNGLIVLPDNWVCQNKITFISGFPDYNGVAYYGKFQTISADKWSIMEAAGAVFLPAAGWRSGTTVRDPWEYGYYHLVLDDDPWMFQILPVRVETHQSSSSDYSSYEYSNGYSVRLVHSGE